MPTFELAVEEEKTYDVSNCFAQAHVFQQYITKCFPGLSLMEASERIHRNLKKVKLHPNEKSSKKNRKAYLDEEGTVYIIEGRKLITAYPNERIFIAKPFLSMKRGGRKYL